jgi:hypothetical protein
LSTFEATSAMVPAPLSDARKFVLQRTVISHPALAEAKAIRNGGLASSGQSSAISRAVGSIGTRAAEGRSGYVVLGGFL